MQVGLMKVLESCQWREKVMPVLLKKYDEALTAEDHTVQNVVLEYYGNFSELSLDVEILSAIDQQLQVNIPLAELPALASKNRIVRIQLPGYTSGR